MARTTTPVQSTANEARRPGRPAVGSRTCSVALTADEEAFLRTLGAGSLTAGVREAVRQLSQARRRG